MDPGLLGALDGREMCAMGKEAFLAKTPPYSGDILWEHLDIMQKGELCPRCLFGFSSVVDRNLLSADTRGGVSA